MPLEGSLIVRHETPHDYEQIRAINDAAFGGTEESELVDALRDEGAVLVSLVAEYEQRVVGHILFSRMWIETDRGRVPAVALAPVAVLPDFQRQGAGRQLIDHGLALLRQRHERVVIVLGHAKYYPRFGFSAAKAQSLAGPFSGESFMALDLERGALDNLHGAVRYAASFKL